MAPKYKLYFFADFPGRAEPSRLLFHYAGQQYEEVGILRENWPAEKSKFLYWQLPVLEVDGKQLAQSITIAKFLGKKFGLAGKDDWEEAKASEICDAINDCALEMTAYFMALGGVVPGDLDQLLDDVLLPALRKCLPLFSKLLAQSDSGFLLPSGLSYVDFVLATFLNVVTKRAEAQEELGKQPPLVEFIARIYGLPKLRDFPTNANI